MARSYAPVLVSIWSDDDFRKLSGAAQRVYILALSQPNITYAGVVDYTARRWARMAADTSIGDLDAALNELVEHRFVVIDDDTEELFIRSFVKHNGVLQQPQLRKAMRRAAAEIHSPLIRSALLAALPPTERDAVENEQVTTPDAPCPHPAEQGDASPTAGCSSTGGLGQGQRLKTLNQNTKPLTPDPEPSSSSRSDSRADTADHDDDEHRITEAMRILAQRALTRRVTELGTVEHPELWLAKAVAERRTRHALDASIVLDASPSMSAVDLANILEPSSEPPRPPAPPRPPCDTCSDVRWLLDDDTNTARPCPACSTEGAA